MYWLLVVRSDLQGEPGDINIVKGLKIGAAPMVDVGLRRLLTGAGIDIEADDIRIAPVPGSIRPGVSFGLTATQALKENMIDGFWANGMGAETAVRQGVGKVVLDVRRGDGPALAFHYTMPALITTDRLIESEPETAEAAVRANVKTQRALKADVTLATEVGRKLFPGEDEVMIADVVERDLPFYEATISEAFVTGINQFARDMNLLHRPAAYEDVVAIQFRHLWNA